MPPDSISRFLIASVRAIKSSKKHLHLVSCQKPVRNLLGAYILPKPLGTLEPLEPPELLRL